MDQSAMLLDTTRFVTFAFESGKVIPLLKDIQPAMRIDPKSFMPRGDSGKMLFVNNPNAVITSKHASLERLYQYHPAPEKPLSKDGAESSIFKDLKELAVSNVIREVNKKYGLKF